MKDKISSDELDKNFKYEVGAQPGGENIKKCFSCGTCTAGCPVSEVDEEFNPRKIIRMVLLGMKKEVLSSKVIWYCCSCYTCYAQCPQNVKFTDIMAVLRYLAIKEGHVRKDFLDKVYNIDNLAQKIRLDIIKCLTKEQPVDKAGENITAKVKEFIKSQG
ncbi:MAG: 4Fe-4S dicluster domain-containing protein [bacterium]|nr:4Fe-4S dicluster domain-containing protein [bacterium]